MIMNVFKHMVEGRRIEMHEAKAKRKIIQNQSVYVEGRRKKTKAKDNFERPVKPVLVKLKNYTLDSKVPVNLCEKLNTPGNTSCPILNTNCLSDSSKVQDKDLEIVNETNILETEDDDEGVKEDEDLSKDDEKNLMSHVNKRKSRNPQFLKSLHDSNSPITLDNDTNGIDDDDDTRDADNDHDEPPVIDIDDDSE